MMSWVASGPVSIDPRTDTGLRPGVGDHCPISLNMWFSVVDQGKANDQGEMREDSKQYTAFTTP